jgi:hypothetical protein
MLRGSSSWTSGKSFRFAKGSEFSVQCSGFSLADFSYHEGHEEHEESKT